MAEKLKVPEFQDESAEARWWPGQEDPIASS